MELGGHGFENDGDRLLGASCDREDEQCKGGCGRRAVKE
jgi:hypothetical protein